jgi:L-threonylcarbamoyladenylate synthase
MALISGDGAVAAAAAQLAAGELVAFPTETVYGLGARADDESAVAKIFAAKGRPADHPLIVHAADALQAACFTTHFSAAAERLADAFWPGPMTLILPRKPGLGAAAAGGQLSIGLRVPDHPVALALLRAAALLGVPGVAGPSANRFGRVSPTTAQHVLQELGPDLCVLDGGPCRVGIESAIVDCTRAVPALLRPGQLSRRAIEAVLGMPLAAPDGQSPRASGTLEAHYAPSVPVVLWDPAELACKLSQPPPAGAGELGVYSRLASAAVPGWSTRPVPGEASAVAHELFSVLRELDAAGVRAIWVERPPPGTEWDGVRDRLQRAAAA